MEILLATNNEHKLIEVKAILEPLGYKVKTLKDFGLEVDPEETGDTFEENALIKAREVKKLVNIPVISDDSGFEVEFLGNQPGVFSARFMGEDTSYDIKNTYIINELKNANDDERKARFVSVIAYVDSDGGENCFKGIVEGKVAKEIRGANGFGYDPIFLLPELEKTFAELSLEEKNMYSHRKNALVKFKEFLVNNTCPTS